MTATTRAVVPRARWAAAPYPVLEVAADGRLAGLNPPAARLFPAARTGVPFRGAVPGWLAEAHERLPARGRAAGRTGEGHAEVASAYAHGPVGDRVYEAHPAHREGGGAVWWFADDTERRTTREALLQEHGRTVFLAEASNLLLSSLDLDRCMEVTAQLAAHHLADAAVVIAPLAGRRLPLARCDRRGGGVVRERLAEDPSEVPGLVEALHGFPPVPSRWIDPAAAPGWLVPEASGEVGSMAVTPLPGHGVPAGALVLLRRTGHTSFPEGEELFTRLFAARAGAAMSAARMYAEQASITETLMRELLPPRLHRADGLDLAAGYRASVETQRIGGDFYDVHPVTSADGTPETLVVLGDVCGKGLEAAVLTGKIRNTLQALLPMADDHKRVLRLLNGALISAHEPRFATLVLASAARDGDRVRLRVTSAGHPAPLVVRADGRVEEVPSRGTLVGALPRVEAESAEVWLAPGETCLLFTDGITEARGGPCGDELFGEARLRATLGGCARLPAEAVVERVQTLAEEWGVPAGGGGGAGQRRHDDMALVALTAPPRAARDAG